MPMKQLIADVLDSVLNGTNIDYGVVSDLSQAEGADLWDLFAAAGRVRGHFRGDIRGYLLHSQRQVRGMQ